MGKFEVIRMSSQNILESTMADATEIAR